MAGTVIAAVSTAISGAAASGVITVTTTRGLAVGAYAYLAAVGQVGETVRIVRIVDGTSLTVRKLTDPRGNSGAIQNDYLGNLFVATAYNPGTLSMPEQFINAVTSTATPLVTVSTGDSTGTPGSATLNTQAGRSAFAAGTNSLVITNALVQNTSVIHATLQTADATLTRVLTVIPNGLGGSFTINGDANATAITNVGWSIAN